MVDFGVFDSAMHIIDVNYKYKWSKNWSLWDTAWDRKLIRLEATKINKLLTIGQIWRKPSICNIADTVVFQFFKKNFVFEKVSRSLGCSFSLVFRSSSFLKRHNEHLLPKSGLLRTVSHSLQATARKPSIRESTACQVSPEYSMALRCFYTAAE